MGYIFSRLAQLFPPYPSPGMPGNRELKEVCVSFG